MATVPLNENLGAFVGGGIGEIRFHHSPTTTVLWSHAKLRPEANGDGRVLIGDVHVYDDTGTLVSETLEARLWFLDENTGSALLGAPDDWYYHVGWQPKTLDGPKLRAAEPGPWLVFADRRGIGEQIAALRDTADARTLLVTPGEGWSINGKRATIRPGELADYRRLIETAGRPSAVLHLWAADASDEASVVSATQTESALHLLQGVLTAADRPRPRLWFVTSGAQQVLGDDACDAPEHAAMWGLARALSVEHAELWGGLVDVGPAVVAMDAARQLMREVELGSAEDKLALRGGQRYVPRLLRRTGARDRGDDFAPRAQVTYLVTGGLGGIGLAMARWLAERGARNLLLLGRTPLPARESWPTLAPESAAARRVAAIASIEALGASIETAAIDVAVEGPLERCLQARAERGAPPVGGVIHAAGVLKFQALELQDVTSLREGIAAKMIGAWRLHRLFEHEPLDCFVMCSSSSALLNSPLLGAYAAGNAFLDALAQHRRAKGLRALSVNWGTWGEVGMAVAARRSGSGAMLSGVGTIPTSKGLAALGELLDSGDVQAAVMPVDWRQFASAYPAFTADPFFAELLGDLPGRGVVDRAAGLSLARLRNSAEDARPELVGSYLRTEAARVLGLVPNRLDPTMPLSSLGFDSLMAVQLKNRIETDLFVVLPMIEFLEGPSVEQLTLVLLQTVDMTASGADLAAATGAWEEGSL